MVRKRPIACGILVCTMIGVSYAQQSVQSQIQQLEQDSEIDQTTIYTNITYNAVNKILARECSEVSIAKGEIFVDAAERILRRKYGIDGALTLIDTDEMYALVATLQKKVGQYQGDKYCTVKYALTNLQHLLREMHLEVMRTSGIIDEFDGVDPMIQMIPALHIKLGILAHYQREYRSEKTKLGATLQPKILNPEFKDGLSNDQRALLEMAEDTMTIMVAESMNDMRDRGFISQDDINQLSAVVQYEYITACNTFHGRYEIRQTYRGDELVAKDPASLTLKVNVCPSYFIIRDLSLIFKKIITHELAHHVYYFNDPDISSYTELCRESDDERNNVCHSDDFVTDYAQTNALEDYAEHFMHWFVGEISDPKTLIQQEKSQHFVELK